MTFLKGKKFTKFKKGRNKGVSNSKLFFCDYGIKSLNASKITKNQIESARKVLSKNIKNNGRILIRVYPDISRTKKPIEVRMGSGKGDIDKYIYRIKPGTVVFEFDTNLCIKDINKIVYLACRKLPFNAFLISKEKQNFF